jgi:hypothetical protein
VSPTTVGVVRAKVESTVQSGQLPKRIGKDGKARKRPPSRTADHQSPWAAHGQPAPDDAEFAPPEEIKKNILDSIERQKAITLAYKKVLKSPSLNQEMEDEVSTAIGGLITILQSLQRALAPGRKREAVAAARMRQGESTGATTDPLDDIPPFLQRTAGSR